MHLRVLKAFTGKLGQLFNIMINFCPKGKPFTYFRQRDNIVSAA